MISKIQNNVINSQVQMKNVQNQQANYLPKFGSNPIGDTVSFGSKVKTNEVFKDTRTFLKQIQELMAERKLKKIPYFGANENILFQLTDIGDSKLIVSTAGLKKTYNIKHFVMDVCEDSGGDITHMYYNTKESVLELNRAVRSRLLKARKILEQNR